MTFSLLNRNIHYLLRKTPFLNDLKYMNIQSENDQGISGNSVNTSITQTIKASFGEYTERETINYENQEKIIAHSMLNYSKKVFSYNEKYFLDSCGLASYTDSCRAITNALEEFIERQSLIYSYLAKKGGTFIPNKLINSNVPNIYRNFSFVNISLTKYCFVVIGLGTISNKFYVGLGSSTDIKIAIQKCVKELNQFLESYNLEKDIDITIRKSDSARQDYNNIFSMLTITELKNAYDYLNNSMTTTLSTYKDISIQKILFDLNKNWNIHPYIAHISCPRKNVNINIVKIFDLNWFPNMNPRTYSEKNYSFVENITGSRLDRNCNFIPFP